MNRSCRVASKPRPYQAPAGTDASIELGANFTVSTDGVQHLQVDSVGRLKFLNGNGKYSGSIYTDVTSGNNCDLLLSGQFEGPPYFKDMVRITSDYDLIVKYGDVKTSTVSGLVGTDASITLDASFKAEVGTAYYQMYSSGFHIFQSDGSQSRFTADGRFLVATQTPDAGYASTFSQSRDGETGLARFVTNNSDGTCSLYVDCDPSTNTATLTASTNFEIKSNQATLTAGDGSEYVPSADSSLVTKKWVETNAASGDFLPLAGGTFDNGVQVVMPSGGSMNPVLQVGGLTTDVVQSQYQIAARGTTNSKNAQVVSLAKEGGKSFFKLGLERGTAVLDTYWNFTHDVAQDVDGNVTQEDMSIGNKSGNWLLFRDDQTNKHIYCNYTFRTPSISGTADNDAAIDLGANCSFMSSGIFNFQFKNADNTFGSKINVGYNETSSGGFANVGVGGCYWYLRDSKRLGIGATGINFNANAATDASTYDWKIEPDGTFVSNADRGVEAAYITAGRNNSGSSLATSPKIVLDGVGITAVNTDGSDYTPTTDNSLVTKQWVESQRPPLPPAQVQSDWAEDDSSEKSYIFNKPSLSTIVPTGTPSDDTTPDSPSGSVLHDNLYLYVKGGTTWKKSALYPLDSSGGGSIFPIPQPGQNSGEVWDTVTFTSGSSVPPDESSVCATGNVFFLNNSWSVNGTDWYQVVWNYNGGQTVQSYAIVDEECRIASYGNGVYCGKWGYSYDGQSWNVYKSIATGVTEAGGSCFFTEGKHWSWGGLYYFDGAGWVTNPNNSVNTGNIGSNPQVKKSTTDILVLDLVRESNVYSRGAVKRWSGDMTTGSWINQGAGASDWVQGCYGIALDGLSDRWVFITSSKAYVQKTSGNFSKSNFDEVSLPTTATWAGLTHDGNRFVAVASTAGANISIWSADGRTWTISLDLDNPGLVSVAGFNGRVIGAGECTDQDRVTCIVTGNPTASTQTTATLPLSTPVDTRSASSVDTGPMARLETQADANGYFDEEIAANKEEIAKKTAVVTLSQAEYDALGVDVDRDTLYLITF